MMEKINKHLAEPFSQVFCTGSDQFYRTWKDLMITKTFNDKPPGLNFWKKLQFSNNLELLFNWTKGTMDLLFSTWAIK